MLFETVSYTGSLPFELSFLNVGEESKHCHREMEILFVLRGITHYQIYHTDYELNPGDLIIADVEDLHQIHNSSDDILMLSLHIDTRRFEHLYPNIRYMFFVCEECMENPSGNKQLLESKLSLLKQHLARLAFDYMQEDMDTALLTEEVNKVVSILVNHFQGFYMEDYQYKTSQEDLDAEDLQRLCRITRYIMLNYKEKISLDDISEQEHLSTYYLSHLIKETLGFNFQNFVNAIRLEFAEKLLVFSNMTLMQISQECGFSSPNYFNKCFSAWHGKTPAQYRKSYTPCQRSYRSPFEQKEALDLLSAYLNVSGEARTQPQLLSIIPDFSSGSFEDFWKNRRLCIVLDSLSSVLMLGSLQEKLECLPSSEFLLNEQMVRSGKELEKALTEQSPFCCRPLLTGIVPDTKQMNRNSTPAAAFEDILKKDPGSIFLTGTSCALFTPEGLETPAYAAYNYFSCLKDAKISIRKDHILVKNASLQAVLLYNPDTTASLKVHLSAEKLPQQAVVIEREFGGDKSCHILLAQLGSPAVSSSRLYEAVRQAARADVKCFRLQGDLELTLDPGSAVILELIVN